MEEQRKKYQLELKCEELKEKGTGILFINGITKESDEDDLYSSMVLIMAHIDKEDRKEIQEFNGEAKKVKNHPNLLMIHFCGITSSSLLDKQDDEDSKPIVSMIIDLEKDEILSFSYITQSSEFNYEVLIKVL